MYVHVLLQSLCTISCIYRCLTSSPAADKEQDFDSSSSPSVCDKTNLDRSSQWRGLKCSDSYTYVQMCDCKLVIFQPHKMNSYINKKVQEIMQWDGLKKVNISLDMLKYTTLE